MSIRSLYWLLFFVTISPILLVLPAICGCNKREDPKIMGINPSNNSDYTVETILTDKEGYTLHRVWDERSDNWVFYVTPGPAQVIQHWKTTDGENTFKHQRTVNTK